MENNSEVKFLLNPKYMPICHSFTKSYNFIHKDWSNKMYCTKENPLPIGSGKSYKIMENLNREKFIIPSDVFLDKDLIKTNYYKIMIYKIQELINLLKNNIEVKCLII